MSATKAERRAAIWLEWEAARKSANEAFYAATERAYEAREAALKPALEARDRALKALEEEP